MSIISLFKSLIGGGKQIYPRVPPYPSSGRLRRRLRPPEQMSRLWVPLSVIHATSDEMVRVGKERRECYVWWGGSFSGADFAHVTTAYCVNVRSSFGRVELHREELHALHQELQQRDQVLLAELHTHPPGAGGQNEVDAFHSASCYPGFLTIVVPEFAHPYFWDPRGAYVYEYQRNGSWRELSEDQIQQRIVVEEPLVEVTQ